MINLQKLAWTFQLSINLASYDSVFINAFGREHTTVHIADTWQIFLLGM